MRRRGDGGFSVTGDLGVRGVVKPVSVEFHRTGSERDPEGIPRFTFKGRTLIDRHDWGVDWNAATRLMIRPLVVVELDVAAYRRP